MCCCLTGNMWEYNKLCKCHNIISAYYIMIYDDYIVVRFDRYTRTYNTIYRYFNLT